VIKRLSYRYPAKLLEAMVYLPTITSDLRKDSAAFEAWTAGLLKHLQAEISATHRYDIEIDVNTETQEQVIKVREFVHSVDTVHTIDNKFFASADYQKLIALGKKIAGLIEQDGLIKRGEKKMAVSDFKAAYDWLVQEAKRGLVISRYKGLGEMNPEQLWETTMDPSTRRLLQVTVDDAVAADQLFTTLMGDQVEPRREFIEANALQVENLDV
jgi:DNA gyrase subunit B